MGNTNVQEATGVLSAWTPTELVVACANDMMIYINNVTVIEMVCASVRITSMICCTVEMKHRNENPLDSTVHMARHRMGTRGNATSFPLPWSSLLSELVRMDTTGTADYRPDLPWTRDELSDKVSILLKTFDDNATETMAKVIHQALVRRAVVMELIQGAKIEGIELMLTLT